MVTRDNAPCQRLSCAECGVRTITPVTTDDRSSGSTGHVTSDVTCPSPPRGRTFTVQTTAAQLIDSLPAQVATEGCSPSADPPRRTSDVDCDRNAA